MIIVREKVYIIIAINIGNKKTILTKFQSIFCIQFIGMDLFRYKHINLISSNKFVFPMCNLNTTVNIDILDINFSVRIINIVHRITNKTTKYLHLKSLLNKQDDYYIPLYLNHNRHSLLQ